MNILSFGAGAIGTYIGGSLALGGHRLVFLEQPQAVRELADRGLSLELRPGQEPRHPGDVRYAASLESALACGPFDLALFALKSYDTAAALEQIRPLAQRMPPVLCLQNGVENEAALAAILGAGKVIPATVTSAVGRRAVGQVVLERRRGVGVGGRQPLSRSITSLLDQAGLNARYYHDERAMKWSKMLINLQANASAAILGWDPARVLMDPRLFALEMRMLREALRVMQALRIRVIDLPGAPVRALAWVCRLPQPLAQPLLVRALGSSRGSKMPSFYLDLQSGCGKSEVDWLNGAVVRLGAKTGVATPVNRLLTDTLNALTRAEIPRQEFAGKPEALLARLSKG